MHSKRERGHDVIATHKSAQHLVALYGVHSVDGRRKPN